jgi:hypothetical protein
MTVAGGTNPTLLGRPKLIAFPDVICSQAYLPNRMDRGYWQADIGFLFSSRFFMFKSSMGYG